MCCNREQAFFVPHSRFGKKRFMCAAVVNETVAKSRGHATDGRVSWSVHHQIWRSRCGLVGFWDAKKTFPSSGSHLFSNNSPIVC